MPVAKNDKLIGIATNWQYPDYGGMLQAYATQMAIDELGCNAEVLDASALQNDINFRKMKYFARNIFDFSIAAEKASVVASSIRRKIPSEFSKNMQKRRSAFRTFSTEHFIRSAQYETWGAISAAAKTYDCVLVGSDQLWLPSNIVGDYYTLSFVPDEVRKVSYATSFGVASIPLYMREKASGFLSRFDMLSARETSGQKIIFELTGRKVPLVCDPTMLIDAERWNREIVSNDALDHPYIFCYLMGNNPYQREQISELKRYTGYQIVQLPHLDRFIASDEGFADVKLYDVDPAGFLSLVKHAALVCTDSFHGTIFSCIFNRKFLVFPRFLKRATLSTNTRIESLLNRLSLNDCFVAPGDNPDSCLDREIDFRRLNSDIHSFKEESLEYLKKELGIVA